MVQSDTVKLVTPSEYISQATELANTAKKRIYVLSCVIADHPATHDFIVALENAAKRGVEVVVAADVFTFGAVIEDFIPGRYKTDDTRLAQRMARELKKAGVSFHWLGNRRATLYNGRTHTKWTVVDDTVFSFGGVNTYQKGLENVDYMLRSENAELAERLMEEQVRIQKLEKRTENYPSFSFPLDDTDSILVDGGMVGQSLIYKRACQLAKEAAHIRFVSQYCPTGSLAVQLRRTPSIAYFNRPSHTNGANKIPIAISAFISRIPNAYQRDTYLHAKLIIFTFPDGSKVALSGSHNYAYTGVLLGTREIALETKNPEIIAQLESFIDTEVARAND